MKRHDSDVSPVAAKLERFELLKERYINVHIIIINKNCVYIFLKFRLILLDRFTYM